MILVSSGITYLKINYKFFSTKHDPHFKKDPIFKKKFLEKFFKKSKYL